MYRRICSVLVFAVLLSPSLAWSQITFDAASSGNGSGTSLTYSHTTGSGSNRALIVDVTLYADASQTVSTVTYNGASLSLITSCTAATGGVRVEQWYMVAPATGTADVVVTPSATTPAIASTASSYTGVNQSTPLGTCATATGTSTGPTVDVTSASTDLVVDALGFWGSGGSVSPTVGAGQTFRDDDFFQHAFGRFYNAVSTEAGATTVTISWTIDGSHNWALVGTPLKQASGGGGSASRLMLLGVGP